MHKIIQHQEWRPSDNITLEENADLSVKFDSNILVIAGPGAGKTELLAQKADYLLQTNLCQDPRKILAISFKKDAAENLKQRINKRCGNEFGSRFSSMTYDAFAKRILDHFRYALPEELRPDANYSINEDAVIDAAFKNVGFNNPLQLSPSKLKTYYDKVISSIVLPLCNNNVGTRVWQLLLKGFDDYSSCLTFKMICILAEYIIRTNPQICKALRYTYSHVFLDEFQDTTDLQYNFVTTCFKDSSSKITAVGDSKQRIMVWAGACKSIFEDFQIDFRAESLKLLMNHRSAPRLVKLQQKMYASLQEDFVDIGTSDKWNSDDGEIKLYISDSEESEAQYIVDDIFEKVSNGVKLNEICILCKQMPQRYTEYIITRLDDSGIKARIETEYQDLVKEPIVSLLINFLLVAIERKSPAEWGYVNEAAEAIWSTGDSRRAEVYYQHQKELICGLNSTSDQIGCCIEKQDFSKIIDTIIGLWGVANIKTVYPAYSQSDYFNSLIAKFVDFLWDEFIHAERNWITAIENFLGLHSIPIMTIHKSKGLEYTAVYFIGLEDGAFWNFRNQPQEDRCAFFVALSRAKQYLTFTFCNTRNNLRYPCQYHTDINEFYELLQSPGMAQVIN